jgi:3-oxoacyl-[acyl-carrier protein] reductase
MDAQLQGFLRGALHTTQAALPGFEENKFGRIINIGTNLLSNPVVPYHDYTAAKGSLLAFTRTSAAELGPENITVNMVSGGLLKTTRASSATPDAVFDTIQSITPLRRVTTPEEVADVVLFFASPWSRGVTGQDINVDGGLVMR